MQHKSEKDITNVYYIPSGQAWAVRLVEGAGHPRLSAHFWRAFVYRNACNEISDVDAVDRVGLLALTGEVMEGPWGPVGVPWETSGSPCTWEIMGESRESLGGVSEEPWGRFCDLS